MKNLIERADTLNKKILYDQISKMQVFRISKYLGMLLFNVYCFVIKTCGTVSGNLREKSLRLKKRTLDSLIDNELTTLYQSNNGMDRLISNVHFHTAKSFSFSGSANDTDSLSTSITKSASNIFRKSELKGKSVYEINDLIYRRYSDVKTHDYPFYLRTFAGILFGSIAGTVFLSIVFPRLFIYCVLLFSIILVISYTLIQRSISILHMATLVWVIMAETDSGEKVSSVTTSLNEDELRMLELRMRALHSLSRSSDILGNEISNLQVSIDEFSNQISRNNDAIHLLVQENSDDARRTKHIKTEENAELSSEIEYNKKIIHEKETVKKKVDSVISDLFSTLIPTIGRKWEALYSKLFFSDEVICKFLKCFSYSDIPMVEKRLNEIENTKNPVAISKRSGNSYILELTTCDESLAYISFFIINDNGKIKINDFIRNKTISEPFVTNSELSEALKGINGQAIRAYEKELHDLRNKYDSDIKRWDSDKKKLQEKNKSLEQTKKVLEQSIVHKQAELDDLSGELDKKETEQKKLLQQLEQINKEYDPERYNALNSEVDRLTMDLNALQRNYKKKLEELDGLYLKVDDLNTENEGLKKDLDKMKVTLEEISSDAEKYAELYRRNEEKIKKQNEEIAKKDSDIAVFNGLLEKTENSQGVDQNTIGKLKNNIQRLKKEKKEIQEALKKSKAEGESLKEELEKTQNDLSKMNSEVKNLESKKSYILYDDEIYKELYKWIKSAQKYIYIIAPFTGKKQFDNMKNRFEMAASKNHHLRIKLLYGIQDRNKDGVLSEERLQQLKESRKRMGELEADLGDIVKTQETNTHCKVIICDDRKFMIGSANV